MSFEEQQLRGLAVESDLGLRRRSLVRVHVCEIYGARVGKVMK